MLGATVGVPVVENDVDVGTWSGSVSDILSDIDSLKLEKIKDDWVNHGNWVLLGGGAKLVDGDIDMESVVGDEEGSRDSEGKLTAASTLAGRNRLRRNMSTLGWG
jgi:hypothetical protein